MAVLQKIRDLFIPLETISEEIIPARETIYEIRPLINKHLEEVWKLNQRCFKSGENYSKATFNYLLTQPQTLSYRMITPQRRMVGFIFVGVENGTAHLTTIGVAPEHRRRGLAAKMLDHLENSLRQREIGMICLEVRVSNLSAQNLYKNLDYAIMQRLKNYYTNGEDGFLMVKSLH
jgi:[ribosomal protein S18]-alanine N-acetyltransferase